MPYYGNRLGIADADLPMEYDVGAIEQIVATPYRGGAHVVFPARKIRFVRGAIVVFRAGKEEAPAYGELTVEHEGGLLTSPLGADGELELEGLEVGTFQGRVVYAKGRCAITIVVPDVPGVIIDLGTMRCDGEK